MIGEGTAVARRMDSSAGDLVAGALRHEVDR